MAGDYRAVQGCPFHADEITYVSLGDGTTSEGEFWEALNTAAGLKLPIIFVVEDNEYAISVPVEVQTAGGNISRLVCGFPTFTSKRSTAPTPSASYAAMAARGGALPRRQGTCASCMPTSSGLIRIRFPTTSGSTARKPSASATPITIPFRACRCSCCAKAFSTKTASPAGEGSGRGAAVGGGPGAGCRSARSRDRAAVRLFAGSRSHLRGL